MLQLILLFVLGGSMVYLAQYNLSPVTLRIGNFTYAGVPLFYVMIGSLLIGLGLSYLIYLINSVFTAFSLHGKDQKIKQAAIEIAELTKHVHKLEIENEKLRKNSGIEETPDEHAL